MKDRKVRTRVIVFTLIEALIVVATNLVLSIATSQVDRCNYYFYDGTAILDVPYTDNEGNEHPAGTEFPISIISENGTVWAAGSHETIKISDTRNSEELTAALAERKQNALFEDIKSNVVVALISFVAAAAVFIWINIGFRKLLGAQIIALVVITLLCAVFGSFMTSYLSRAKAPVIYLYPEEETEINVRLELDGGLKTTYPKYDEDSGWTVTALPDGTLTDKSGREYSFLFWEGNIAIKPDLNEGFCVRGEDTADFLEISLRQLGLNEKESDAFIMYWLPLMEGNAYNIISFQTDAYEKVVKMDITPEPDTVLRVNMLWYPSDSYVDICPQDLTGINPSIREGFTVVEWGGEKYERGIMTVFK